IRGRIVNADGVPMRLRRVMVDSADGTYGPYITVTDHEGRYEVRNLPEGRYRLSASDLGGAPIAYGQRRPTESGAVIALKVGAVVVPTRGGVSDWPGYARTYFLGTVVPQEAQRVDVGAEQDALNVDITLMREHGARISGTAYTAAGKPLQGSVSLAQSLRSRA